MLHEMYRELRPRAPIPEFDLQFYPFANINNTIRFAEGRMKCASPTFWRARPNRS